MGFRDIFKAKHKHSNPEVRKQAVKELTDSEVLADIALNDEDSGVRLNAVENNNLVNPLILGKIVEKEASYSTVRKVAREKLERIVNNSSQDELISIVSSNPYDEIRVKATEKITDEESLKNLALYDSIYSVKKAAIENTNLNNQDTFIFLARNDEDSYIRRIAMNHVRDEEVLVDIVKNEKDTYLRKEFVNKFADEDVLNYFAYNDIDIEVQNTALYKLKELHVDEMIKNSSNVYNEDLKDFERLNITTDSIYDIGNHEVLIVLDDGTNITSWNEVTDTNRILYITENFINQDTIDKRKYKYMKSVVGYDDYQDPATDEWKQSPIYSYKFKQLKSIVITGITKSVTDLSLMFEDSIVHTISFHNCDMSSINNITGMFLNCTKLKNLYGLDSMDTKQIEYPYYVFYTCNELLRNNYPQWYDSVDLPAVNEIEDKNILIKIAKNDPLTAFRQEAIEKIDDEEVLMEIIAHEEDTGIKCTIVEKIEDEDLLIELAQNERNEKVRKICYDKIDSEKLLEDINFLADIAKHGEYPENVEAALKIYDTDLLKDIAQTADNNFAKYVAIERIDDDLFLKSMLDDNYVNRDVRCNVARLIKEEKYLYDIAKDFYDEYFVRIEAVKRITNQDVLCSIAENNLDYNYDRRVMEDDDSVRVHAIEKVQNEGVLKSILNSRTREKIKREAARNPFLKDEQFLASIAKTYEKHSWAAVANPNLKNQKLLLEIVNNAITASAKAHAASKIEDQEILMKLLHHDNKDIRGSAIYKINDVKLVEEYARFESDDNIRWHAVSNSCLTDMDLLIYIAKNDSDSFVRGCAIKKIKDNDILIDLLKHEKDNNRLTDILRNQYLTDEELLIHTALENDDKDIRYSAIDNPNFTDQAALLEVILKEKDYFVRKRAITKLTDPDVVLFVVKDEENRFVREESVEVLDKEGLEYLINNDLCEDVRIKAIERLNRDKDSLS